MSARRWATVALGAALLATAACTSSSSTSSPTTPSTATAAGTTPGSSASGTAASGATTGTAAPVPAASPGCRTRQAPPPTGSHVDLTLTSGGVARTYKQYLPASYGGTTPVPLVVDLHGYQEGNAVHTALSNLSALADTKGFAVVTPQGSVADGIPYWNSTPNDAGPPDLQFLSDLIDHVGTQLCVDPRRVYVSGMSNGAFMTSLVGCRLAGKVAAVAPVAGLQLPKGCDPARPIPIVAFHGTADQFVTYDGSTGSAVATLPMNADTRKNFESMTFEAIPDALAGWARLEGCAATPTETPVTASVTLVAYTGCRDGSTVELYRSEGAGHSWPGSAFSKSIAKVVGPTDMSIDADALMWAFFEQHPLPG